MIGMIRMGRSRLIGLGLVAMIVSGAASADAISWQGNYAKAHQEAVRTGRPVLVSVSSRGCGWCRELDRTTFRDPKVVGLLNGRTIPLKIDANDPAHERLVEALGLQGVPTLAAIGPDGRILANQAGYLDPTQFLSWIGPVVQNSTR